MLSFTGSILGIIVGGAMFLGLKNHIETSFAIPFQRPEILDFSILVILCLALGVLTGVSATLFPAIRSSGLEPNKALFKVE